MSDLFGAAYRGDPSIPHVSEDFFKLVLVSANVRVLRRCSMHGSSGGGTGQTACHTGCTLVRQHARTHFWLGSAATQVQVRIYW